MTVGLYQSEPQYKTFIGEISLEVEIISEFSEQLVRKLASEFCRDVGLAVTAIKAIIEKPFGRILLLKDINKNKILGFSIFHWLKTGDIYHHFNSREVSSFIYENSAGKIALIDGIFYGNDLHIENIEKLLLTETIANCLEQEFEYCIFNCNIESKQFPFQLDTLKYYGFEKLNISNKNNHIFYVNMNNPCSLYLDVRTLIKEPYLHNDKIRKVIYDSRKKLMLALTKLYPGQLLLPFDRRMLHEAVTRKICADNEVPLVHSPDVTLGKYMCVPFGRIMQNYTVPNTVTKALHTEKYFDPDMKHYKIGATPFYSNLEIQMKTIKSFDKPVILVDDLLSKGYRMMALDPIINKAKVNVHKILVGILTNKGKELMEIQGRQVDSAYYIPKLKAWFNESLLYPFIDGDAIWRGYLPKRNLLPSLNLILPYTYPSFIKEATRESIYNLSETCIQNSIDILKCIEEVYQERNARSLTLASMGSIFKIPRCPEHGKDMDYNINLSPSYYLENDLELLRRIKN